MVIKSPIFKIFIVIAFSSCSKIQTSPLSIKPIECEYLDTKSDSLKFIVFGENPFNPIDSEIWIKTFDSAHNINTRLIKFKIFSKKNHLKYKNFYIETNRLSTTDSEYGEFLSVYKQYLMNENAQKFYYESEDVNTTRYFSSKMVNIKTNIFSGPCIHSYLDKFEITKDTSGIRTFTDEYYAPKKGLIKIIEQRIFLIKGFKINDSTKYKYRVY